MHVLQVFYPSQGGVAYETTCLDPSSSVALCARNARITVYDVTTWSWVNLVNPVVRLARFEVAGYRPYTQRGGR